jgi:hypothetical protein
VSSSALISDVEPPSEAPIEIYRIVACWAIIGSHIIAWGATRRVTNFFLLILSINFGDSTWEYLATRLGTEVDKPI